MPSTPSTATIDGQRLEESHHERNAVPFQLRTSACRCVVGDGHDGEHRIESAVGHVHAAVDHEDVVDIVQLAVAVHHGTVRIVAHAARAGLVLAGGDAFGMPAMSDGIDGAGLLEPRFGAFRLHVADLEGVRMHVAFEARHRKSPLVAHLRVEVTRPVADGISCVGPMMTMVRLCQWRMACLWPLPQRGVSGGRRSTMWMGRRMNSLASMPPPQRPGVPWL